MDESNCWACEAKITGGKYNPYNITFKHFYFGSEQRAGEGVLCLKCGNSHIERMNECKGGNWTLKRVR